MAVEDPEPPPNAPDVEIDEYGTNTTHDEPREAAEADALLREAMGQACLHAPSEAQMAATNFLGPGDANATESGGPPRERTTRRPEESPFPPTPHAWEPPTTRRSTAFVTMCALCALAAKPLPGTDRTNATALGGTPREGTTSLPANK